MMRAYSEDRQNHTSRAAAHISTGTRNGGKPAFLSVQTPHPVAQLKISTRDGHLFQATEVNDDDSGKLREMKTVPERYLVPTATDVTKLEAGETEGVRILAPYKHVIGELHNASRFDEAVADWGWGASYMREDLSRSDHMEHVEGDKRRKDQTSKEYNALPLEDTMVKNMALLVRELHLGEKLMEDLQGYHAGNWAITIESMKGPLKTRIKGISDRFAASIRFIFTDIAKFFSQLKPKGLWNEDRDPGRIQTFKGVYDNFKLTHANLLNQIAEPDKWNLDLDALDRFIKGIPAVIGILQAYFAELEPHAAAQTDIGQSIAFATDTKNSLRESIVKLNPSREYYMGQNIRDQLQPLPGLVKIGREHLKGIKDQNIPQAILHNDYTDFAAETEAKKSDFKTRSQLKQEAEYDVIIERIRLGIKEKKEKAVLIGLLDLLKGKWNGFQTRQQEEVRNQTLDLLDHYSMNVGGYRPAQAALEQIYGFTGLTPKNWVL